MAARRGAPPEQEGFDVALRRAVGDQKRCGQLDGLPPAVKQLLRRRRVSIGRSVNRPGDGFPTRARFTADQRAAGLGNGGPEAGERQLHSR